MPKASSFPRHSVLVALALAVVAIATFYSVISCQFINVDDGVYVTANDHVRQGLSLKNSWWALTTLEAANWHPVTWMSHLLDVSLFGLDPRGHHETSLLIHTLNVVLLFIWLHSSTKSLWRSALVAAVFAVHPLGLDSVAFIAERKNVLSTLFLLLTLLAYLYYIRKPEIGRYFLVLLPFALGLMSKAMLVTVPFLLLLLDYWPLGRLGSSTAGEAHSGQRSKIKARIFLSRSVEKVPLLLLAAATSLLTIKAQALDREIKIVPLASRIANAALSYSVYLKQMFWPSQLAIFYPYRNLNVFSWPVVVATLGMGAITALVVVQSRKRPYLAVGWFWYVGTLVPVIGLVHIGDLAHADRYTYVPLVGIFIAISWVLGDLVTRFPIFRYVVVPSSFLAILSLAITTIRDVPYWHDGISISEHSIAVTGSNCLMERTLGETLYAQGNVDAALMHLTRSIQEQPTDAALYDIGTIKLQQNKLDEAAFYLQEALGYPGEDRTMAHVYNNLGIVKMQQGSLIEAENDLKKAVALDPGTGARRISYGWLLMKESRFPEAVFQFEEAVKDTPDATAYFYLGSALEQDHKLDAAVDAYRRTLVLAPNLQEARARLNAISALSNSGHDSSQHYQ